MGPTPNDPEVAVAELADAAKPDDIPEVDRQFAAKLSRLEQAGTASGEMVARLRVMWAMLKASDELVPWRDKALIMAALSYFASPFDLIPDLAGKVGYLDDARVVEIVWDRIHNARNAFGAAQD